MRMLQSMMLFAILLLLPVACRSQRQEAEKDILKRFRESPVFWTDGISTFSLNIDSVKLISLNAERAGVDLFALYQEASSANANKLQLAYCLIASENTDYVHAVEQDIAAGRMDINEFRLWTMVLTDYTDAGDPDQATLSQEYAEALLRILRHIDAPHVHLLFAARSVRENNIWGALDKIMLVGSSSFVWQSPCWELLQQMPVADVTEYLLLKLDAQDAEGIYAAGLLIEMNTPHERLAEDYLNAIISGNNLDLKKAAEAELLRLR